MTPGANLRAALALCLAGCQQTSAPPAGPADTAGPATARSDTTSRLPDVRLPPPTPGLHLDPGPGCRPGAPAPGVFTRSNGALGIDFRHDATPIADPGGPPRIEDFAGAGIGDLDGDGELDLYFAGGGAPDRIYLTGGRGPAHWTAIALPQVAASRAVTIADLDGDGDRDVVLVSDMGPVPLWNDGAAGFSEGLPLEPEPPGPDVFYSTFSVAVGDLDGDGWLDVYVGNHEEQRDDRSGPAWPGPEWLMMGGPDGFRDGSAAIPIPRVDDKTFIASLVDLDDDGDLDIYETNDAFSLAQLGIDPTDQEQQGNRLYRTDRSAAGLTLSDVTAASGAANMKVPGMGAGLGDYDNDGLIDIYVTGMRPDRNVLLHNDGGLRFTDVTVAMNADSLTEEHDVGWGAVFLDADADGWLDIFVAQGFNTFPAHLSTNPDHQTNVLLRNSGGQGFDDATTAAGVAGDGGWSRSPTVGDLDRDGFPDLIVTNADGEPDVWLNGCDGRPWLTVRLADSGPNRHGIGARIRVTAGALVQTRAILAGSDGLFGTSAAEAYFGFPDGTTEVTLEVRWPDGQTEQHEAVPTRRLATLAR